jgi:hypothetical protein
LRIFLIQKSHKYEKTHLSSVGWKKNSPVAVYNKLNGIFNGMLLFGFTTPQLFIDVELAVVNISSGISM